MHSIALTPHAQATLNAYQRPEPAYRMSEHQAECLRQYAFFIIMSLDFYGDENLHPDDYDDLNIPALTSLYETLQDDDFRRKINAVDANL